MSERGVFAVDRGIFDHPKFKDDKVPLTKLEAWMWLLANAAFKAHRRRVSGIDFDLKRGQLVASSRYLAERWRWKEPRVRRFLTLLKTDAGGGAEIDAQTDAGITLITIRKYNTYQRVSLPSDAPSDAVADAQTDAEATHHRRNKEDKENREEDLFDTRATPPADDWPEDYEEQFWAKWPNKVAKKPGMKALANARKRVKFAVLMAALDRFIETQNPQFYGHPASWLNADRWTDEPQTRTQNGHTTRDHRTPATAGPSAAKPDPILAGLGRIASRIAARGNAARSGDGALPFGEDAAGGADADGPAAGGDGAARCEAAAAARPDADCERGFRSGDAGGDHQADEVATRPAA